jgi:hypothetical protein
LLNPAKFAIEKFKNLVDIGDANPESDGLLMVVNEPNDFLI